jgi:hypothetical protein
MPTFSNLFKFVSALKRSNIYISFVSWKDDEVHFLDLPNPSSRTIGPGVDWAYKRNEYQEFFWG